MNKLNPKSLRIDNWVRVGGVVGKIEAISPIKKEAWMDASYLIEIKSRAGKWAMGDVKGCLGIALDAEVLKKIKEFEKDLECQFFMFETEGQDIQAQFSYVEPCQDTDNHHEVWVYVDHICCFQLRYLHDLQNKFYEFSDGKELTINL